MQNNIKELFIFFFGPDGEIIKETKGSLGEKEIQNILLNYSIEQIYQLQENQGSVFNLQIGNDFLDFKYDFFQEHPTLSIFSELSYSFRNQTNLLIERLSTQLVPNEVEISQYLSDLLFHSMTKDLSGVNGDKFAYQLNEIKHSNPETYNVFKTFMRYRPNIWTQIVNSTSNKNTAEDKIKKIIFALSDLTYDGSLYFKQTKENSKAKVKEYLENISLLSENNFSIPAFICYLLKNPSQFKMVSV